MLIDNVAIFFTLTTSSVCYQLALIPVKYGQSHEYCTEILPCSDHLLQRFSIIVFIEDLSYPENVHSRIAYIANSPHIVRNGVNCKWESCRCWRSSCTINLAIFIPQSGQIQNLSQEKVENTNQISDVIILRVCCQAYYFSN